MQLGQILPYSDCRSQMPCLGHCVVRWCRARCRFGPDVVAISAPHRSAMPLRGTSTAHFGSVVSALSATLFTFALLMQGVASLVLSGCEK